jgi:alkylhydroperoxidase/carboxymuconolactone decarboxylase family protein YurZ
MAFQMTREMDAIFDRCREDTLDTKTTELVRFACQVAAGNEQSARTTHAARKGGVSAAELARAACLAACSVGPRATAAFATIAGKGANALDEASVFAECSERTLDDKTQHLVSLAVCLVHNCMCAAGHIVRLRELKVDDASIHRAACLAACEGGLNAKYAYLEQLDCATREARCAC